MKPMTNKKILMVQSAPAKPIGWMSQFSAQAQAMLDKYAAILNAPVPNEDQLPELSAEYQERLEDIDLRAELRQE